MPTSITTGNGIKNTLTTSSCWAFKHPKHRPNANRMRSEQAARERNLEFPILVDLHSANWKAWSNTMWPTVYVSSTAMATCVTCGKVS